MVARMTFCQRNIKKTFPRPVRLWVRLIIIIWCDGVKIPLTVNENKSYVLVETAKIESVRKSAVNIRGGNTRTIDNYAALGIRSSKEFRMQKSLTSFTLDNAQQKSINPQDVVYEAPYFKTSDGADLGITNVFSVQLTGEQDLAKLQKIAEEYNLEILGENEFDPSIYYLSCTKESKGNALEMANFMYESGAFEYATPEFIVESMPDAAPNDTYFSYQWNLKNVSYPGIDINYVNARNAFAFPYINDIIVAVVDNGVYNNHDDLHLYNVSYNAHTGGIPSGLYGDHGTKVAGVIGATANNGKGIAGVASGVKIMPISICYTDNELGIAASTTTNFANAIRFAANNGARVINNSWSFDTSSPISEINNAITYAHGKGCIVVFSSGNKGSAVSQPAAGAPSATLVVGAIDRNGYKSDFSGYGSSLDVVAPGREIWTTDVTGGYTCVSGTSFAAPHVSGIVALIWATDPDLSVWRDIIEQTTRKIGGNTYGVDPLRLNGLWNQFVGYGLVNAYAAVSAVSGSAPTADFASDTDEPVLHDIECRVLKNGLSTSSGVHLALIPQGYSY